MFPLTVAYHVDRLGNETQEQYMHRMWFIAKQAPRTLMDFEQAVKFSIIDMMMEFHKCEYGEDVVDLVNRMKVRIVQ